MTSQALLGGFKILKDVVRISLLFEAKELSEEVFRRIAEEKINLPYVTLVAEESFQGVNLVVEAADEGKIRRLIPEKPGLTFTVVPGSAILSVFPHKRNPEISARLFEVFERERLEPDALANSPSTLSVVLTQDLIDRASHALFEPFAFSAYQTAEDWNLAQQAREKSSKEVVASYQERRPKVYGLELYEGQHLVQIKLSSTKITQAGTSLRGFARLGTNLTFLATSPSHEKGKRILVFSLPASQSQAYAQVVKRIAPQFEFLETPSVMIFSLNGPHFGDRHGIVSEILDSMGRRHVNILALSCTIASISGVVHKAQAELALKAIQERFEVPSITQRQ